jgi:hypothetical protein
MNDDADKPEVAEVTELPAAEAEGDTRLGDIIEPQLFLKTTEPIDGRLQARR